MKGHQKSVPESNYNAPRYNMIADTKNIRYTARASYKYFNPRVVVNRGRSSSPTGVLKAVRKRMFFSLKNILSRAIAFSPSTTQTTVQYSMMIYDCTMYYVKYFEERCKIIRNLCRSTNGALSRFCNLL
jgi:hypothetical protein